MRTEIKTSATDNPYSYISPVQWPIIRFKDPYLVPDSSGNENLSATISIKIPLNLDKTIRAHCRTMGVNRSDWLRTAVLHLLSAEQQWLD